MQLFGLEVTKSMLKTSYRSRTLVQEAPFSAAAASLPQPKPKTSVFASAGYSLVPQKEYITAEHSSDLKLIIRVIEKAKLLKAESLKTSHCDDPYCAKAHRAFKLRCLDDWVSAMDKKVSDYIATKEAWVASRKTKDQVSEEIEAFRESLEELVNELVETILVDPFSQKVFKKPVWSGNSDLKTGRTSNYLTEEDTYKYIRKVEIIGRRLKPEEAVYSPLDREENSSHIHEMPEVPTVDPYMMGMTQVIMGLNFDEDDAVDQLGLVPTIKTSSSLTSAGAPIAFVQKLSDELPREIILESDGQKQVFVITEEEKQAYDQGVFLSQQENIRNIVKIQRAEEIQREKKLFDQVQKLVAEKLKEAKEKLSQYKEELTAQVEETKRSMEETKALQQEHITSLKATAVSMTQNHVQELSRLQNELDGLKGQIGVLNQQLSRAHQTNKKMFVEFKSQIDSLEEVYNSGIASARDNLYAKEANCKIKISIVEQHCQESIGKANSEIKELKTTKASQATTIAEQGKTIGGLEAEVKKQQAQLQNALARSQAAIAQQNAPRKRKKFLGIF